MIKNKILLGLLWISASAFGQNCVASREEGFTIPPRDNERQTYECNNIVFPYFSQLNYTIQPGINCFNSKWPGKVVMECENRSRQERDVGNVSMLCCDSQ